jgi:hypothetical protein
MNERTRGNMWGQSRGLIVAASALADCGGAGDGTLKGSFVP